MRAVRYDRFGPASDVLRLVDHPCPSPGRGEVLVRLIYSGANPSDVKARAGGRPGVSKPAFDQIIPHSDGAGVIEAVGAHVDPGRIGQRVWIWNGQWQRAFGTAAEYIALSEEQAVPLPAAISLETGAALGIPGLTATHAVFGGGEVADKTLLVAGGAGAVGHNAVQLARWGGARVISTARGAGADRARAAGADIVFDYAAPDLAGQIMAATDGRGIDRAIEPEFGQNAALLGEVMAPNGKIAAYGSARDMSPTLPFGPYLFKALTIDILLIYLLSRPARDAAIFRLHKALEAGALVPAIHSTTFDLATCAAAHDAIAKGEREGALLLRCTMP